MNMKARQLKMKPIETRSRSSSSPIDANHWKFSISVMGATPKQRSIYINTWIDIKASAKKKQAVRTTYGQFFHIKHASSSISLDLFVHDIQNVAEINKIWNDVILNVIVLPYNHTNDSVDKPLKHLIRELPHTNIPLRKLFSKTLLICPSNFHSMTKDEYLKQTSKVSQGLLDLIHTGLGQFKSSSLNLMSADIVMMESGRKSSILPIGRDWRVVAAEYTLKHLIFNDRDRKAFIAWILNIPKPLNAQDIMIISQRLKQWKTSRRRLKKDIKNKINKPSKIRIKRNSHHHHHHHHHKTRQHRSHSGDTQQNIYNQKRYAMLKKKKKITPKTNKKQTKLSSIVKDFENDNDEIGIEATLNLKYQQMRKERQLKLKKTNKQNKPIISLNDISQKHKHKHTIANDEIIMNQDLADLLVMSDEEEKIQTHQIQIKPVLNPTIQSQPQPVKKKIITPPKAVSDHDHDDDDESSSSDNDSDSDDDDDESESGSDSDDESSSSSDSSSDESDSDNSSSDDESDNDKKKKKKKKNKNKNKNKNKKKNKKNENNTDSLREFCKNANLLQYYKEMVSLGFNSSSEFLDLNEKDLSDLILKLDMNFKHDKQFRKFLDSAKIACGMIESQQEGIRTTREGNIKLDKLERHDSFSPLSTYDNGKNNDAFFNTMDSGISKMALIDLTNKMREFTKISEKCSITLNKLGSTYEAAQIEMDRVYNEYKRQIDDANIKAKEILHSFVNNKQNKIIILQKTMKTAVNNMKKCEEECQKQYKLGNQDTISHIIQNTMKNIKLPSDFSVSSWKFDVEYVEKLDIFPPVLQPDNTPYYNPIINTTITQHHSNHNSQSSIKSLQDIIDENINNNQGFVSPLSPTNININKPIIRRSSVILGDIDPTELQKQSKPVVQPHPHPQPLPSFMTNPYNPSVLNPYNPIATAQLAQQQQQMMNQFMFSPINNINQQQQIAAQQALLQQQQFQQQYIASQQHQQQHIYTNGHNNHEIKQEEIKQEESTSNINIMNNNHINKYEWLETKDLWRGGHVSINGDTNSSVTINGGCCVIANIEITARDNIFYWEIYIEKISNRCWIGILPGPISSINWKIGECPPTNNKAIGIENTYGFIYKSTTKCSSIGRAPKNRDHIRFKLDIKNNILYGSLNDKQVNKVFYKGNDIPKIACIAIINSTGKGKFHIRN